MVNPTSLTTSHPTTIPRLRIRILANSPLRSHYGNDRYTTHCLRRMRTTMPIREWTKEIPPNSTSWGIMRPWRLIWRFPMNSYSSWTTGVQTEVEVEKVPSIKTLSGSMCWRRRGKTYVLYIGRRESWWLKLSFLFYLETRRYLRSVGRYTCYAWAHFGWTLAGERGSCCRSQRSRFLGECCSSCWNGRWCGPRCY